MNLENKFCQYKVFYSEVNISIWVLFLERHAWSCGIDCSDLSAV